MKVNKFLLAGVAVLGLGMTACNNDDIPPVENPTGGSTFAGMYISTVKDVTTKAVNDKQEDYGGREAESKLSELQLLSNDRSLTWTLGTAPDEADKFWETTAGSGIFTVAPWKTNPGPQSMALLFNKGSITIDIVTASDNVFGNAAEAVENIKALATDDKFVMTSKAEQRTIAPDISEETAKTGTSEAQNVFSFDVERVVAQGLVAKGDALVETTVDNKGKVALDDIMYAAINGAVKTYLFRNHAGERTIGADGLYAEFVSAIDGYADFENAKDPNGSAKEHLIRLGNILPENGTVDNLGMYEAKSVSASAAEAKNGAGIYFLENSVDKAQFTPANKNFGFYRLPYAKIYATYIPNEVWKLEDGKLVKETNYQKGTTFYRGEGDGLIYASKEAAQKSQLSPNQKAYTYTNGRCAYRALWNRQTDTEGKTVVNADVRRNNTYLLTITAFQGLGMPWDPSDPKDPYLPEPTDPTEPTDPENPDIEKEETYMRVEAKVLQWNLVSRDVVLE
ncbi:Mfa1 family fimbria major subunit [Parabacteroides timonensis]|uniref:Mfa1 family fimbria major subunit n=1 Tax=Parabacteroides timonensis TaxID=1871013 RepID=UPI00094E4219|nr:Mfa1 family fimbria major subunit [Parabacteroides timonensis]